MKLTIIGGHLSPALAVIDALPKNTKVLFIGRKFAFEGDRALSLEYREIASRKIPFATISTGRLQRKFTQYTIPSLFKIPCGFVQSLFILRNFRPDVVLSFGGYLSVPVGITAFLLRIPLVIHEQTLEAGAANRVLSFFSNKICISWETSKIFFPKNKTILTGNPMRKFQILNSEFTSHGRHSGKGVPDGTPASRISMVARDSRQARMTSLWNMNRELPVIYVTGGSGGSHYINTLIEACLKELLEKFVVVHQTGDAQEYLDFDRLNAFRNSLPFKLKARYRLIKFVDPHEVGSILKKADLVVGRSGINTITELIFFKKPCLLIPLPYSQNNEQLKNALFLKGLGLTEVFYQDTLDSKKFLRLIGEMFNNIDRYKIRKLVQDDTERAAQKIVEVICYEAKNKKK